MNQLFDTILNNAYTADATDEDYVNPDDNLCYCGKCHTPKEAFFENGFSFNGVKKHPTECRCAAERRQAEGSQRKRTQTSKMHYGSAYGSISGHSRN